MGRVIFSGLPDEDVQTWERLNETRSYTGATNATAGQAAQAGMKEALAEGYVAESVTWLSDQMVRIEFTYDPKRAGRPL